MILEAPVQVREGLFATQTRFDPVRRCAVPVKTTIRVPDDPHTGVVLEYDSNGDVVRQAVYRGPDEARRRVLEDRFDSPRSLDSFGYDIAAPVREAVEQSTREYLAENNNRGN